MITSAKVVNSRGLLRVSDIETKIDVVDSQKDLSLVRQLRLQASCATVQNIGASHYQSFANSLRAQQDFLARLSEAPPNKPQTSTTPQPCLTNQSGTRAHELTARELEAAASAHTRPV